MAKKEEKRKTMFTIIDQIRARVGFARDRMWGCSDECVSFTGQGKPYLPDWDKIEKRMQEAEAAIAEARILIKKARGKERSELEFYVDEINNLSILSERCL